jgi:beta-glucosidase
MKGNLPHIKNNKKNVFFIFLFILILGIAFFLLKDNNIAPPSDILSERCKQKNALYLDYNLPVQERVNDLMSKMTDWEKIGQMVLIEKNSIHDIGDIARYNLGALLSGGGAKPEPNTPLAWLQMVNNFQSAAKNTCLEIPLLYGIDAVHGHGNMLGATIFPHAIGLGATRDQDLVKRVAKATAEELAATGIYWSFSPNIDVAKDIRWGKTYETFGSNTANVTQLGTAYLKGTQESSDDYFKVLATLKHFIGGGAMEYGTSRNRNFKVEEGNITIDEKTLRQEHLAPFKKAVEAGAQSVMVGTATWNGKINPSNSYLLTDLLKKEFGFSGFVVSDWYAVYEISPSRYDSLVTAINAGVDMVMTPFEYKDFMYNMEKALSSGDITKDRLDDAVRRILTAKFNAGLFDRPEADQKGLSIIGNKEHRELAREAVRKSQVLLKNKDSVLPLSSSLEKIIVAGSSADNLGRQAGGWTIEWQGIEGNNDIPGTTILQSIKNIVSESTEVEYNKEGNFSSGNNLADVGIVVVGEKPYAEGWGDNANPNLSPEDLLAIERTKTKSKKLIVVIISGRPLDISSYSEKWDAIVASWLPGSEGEGVSDVLFGGYPFTGVLPIKWDI